MLRGLLETGGIFANGAVTAAFARAFNDEGADHREPRPTTEMIDGKVYRLQYKGTCGTAECVMRGANIDFNHPDTQAFFQASLEQDLSLATNVAQVLSFALPATTAARVAGFFIFSNDAIRFANNQSIAPLAGDAAGQAVTRATSQTPKAGGRLGVLTGVIVERLAE